MPLGSVSRPAPRPADPPGTATCQACGSTALTRLRMLLADGAEVVYVTCAACEHRAWFDPDGDGEPLDPEDVLARSSRRPAGGAGPGGTGQQG